MTRTTLSWQYRLAVASRAIAAILGGYALTALAATLLATLLPMTRGEASVSATLLAFAWYCGVVIWVFAARTAWRAWGGVLLTGAALALAQCLSGSLA